MNISLPDPLKEYVEAQIASGRYSSASEYLRMLIREDEKHKAQEKLQSLLLEGLATGESDLTRQDFQDIRKAALARLKARRKKGRNAARA
jgi:antitoxin ParD1/3/4